MNVIDYNLISDTGVERAHDRESYSRVWEVAMWNPHDDRMLGRAEVLVQRTPSQSHLQFSVFTETGWHVLVRVGADDWWRDVPGANRNPGDEHTRRTTIALDLAVQRAVHVATCADVL